MEERTPRVARAEERGEDGGVRDDIAAGQVGEPEEEARGSREVAGPEEAGAHGGAGAPSPAPIERAPRVAHGAHGARAAAAWVRLVDGGGRRQPATSHRATRRRSLRPAMASTRRQGPSSRPAMAAAAMASELEQGTELEEEPGHATAAPDFEQLGRRGPAGGGADPAAEIRPRA